MTLPQKNDFERILEILEYKILSGVLNPRERLIEKELTKEYKISTGTVRKILKELAIQKFIVHIPNRGAVVAAPTQKEVEDIYHTRVLLEDYAIEFVLANMDPSQLKKIEAHGKNFEKKLKEKNLRGILNSNRLFHQSIFEVCGNKIISEMINQLRNRSRTWYHYISGNAKHLEDSVKDHIVMIECLHSKNKAKLKKINKKHLSIAHKIYKKETIIT